MATQTVVAKDDIVYQTPHGRVIVRAGDTYTVDDVARRFTGITLHKLPPPLPPAAQTINSALTNTIA